MRPHAELLPGICDQVWIGSCTINLYMRPEKGGVEAYAVGLAAEECKADVSRRTPLD